MSEEIKQVVNEVLEELGLKGSHSIVAPQVGVDEECRRLASQVYSATQHCWIPDSTDDAFKKLTDFRDAVRALAKEYL